MATIWDDVNHSSGETFELTPRAPAKVAQAFSVVSEKTMTKISEDEYLKGSPKMDIRIPTAYKETPRATKFYFKDRKGVYVVMGENIPNGAFKWTTSGKSTNRGELTTLKELCSLCMMLHQINKTTPPVGSDELALEVAKEFGFKQAPALMREVPISYSDAEGTRMVDVLRSSTSQEVTLQRMEFVGPQVGDELREQGGLAMLLALGLVLIYVGFRFQLKFAMGAVIALAHDVLIILGFFSITRLEFDLSVLAAILAVIGYSLNDTIVVSDRIRENLRKIRKMSPLGVIDVSLNETLGRTLVTSLTTMLVLTSLAILGGDMIFGFAVALLVGVSVGTYSSIYVASTSLLALGVTKEDVAIPVKEGEDQDAIAP